MRQSNRNWPQPVADDYLTHMYLAPDLFSSEYDDVFEYALTIDGYKYATERWGVASEGDAGWQMVLSFKHGDDWNGTFEDLRCCLFFYQRNIRWIESGAFAKEERDDFMKIYRTLCELWQKRQLSSESQLT